MKVNLKRVVFTTALVVCSCLAAMITLAALSPKKPITLYLVKKIYVAERMGFGSLLDPRERKLLEETAAAEKVMNAFLERELVRVGFEVVRDKNSADAVLSGQQGVTIITDAPLPDPPEYVYEYHLTPPSNPNLWETEGEIWRTEVKTQSKILGPSLTATLHPELSTGWSTPGLNRRRGLGSRS